MANPEKLKRIQRRGETSWSYVEVVPEGHFADRFAEWYPHATVQVVGFYPHDWAEKKEGVIRLSVLGDPVCRCGSIEEADRIVANFFDCEVKT